MFYTEILVERQAIDLYADKALRYTLQVNSIAELKDRQTTYTKSYLVPRTAKNIRIFGALGMPSDTSHVPYTKPNCELKIDGFNFIAKGWLNVTEAGDDYKITIFSGIIEFFKSLEGKKLGADFDLSEINHAKNLSNVVSSFTNPNYRYLITDYNGKTHYGQNGDTINIDYLVPSVNVRYLFDKIHTSLGFTYTGLVFDSPQFQNLWITYPKPIPLGGETELKSVNGTKFINSRNSNVYESFFEQLIAGGLDNNISFKIPETGTYRIIFESDNVFGSSIFGGNNGTPRAQYFMSVNQVGTPFSTRVNPTVLLDIPRFSGQYNANKVIDFVKDDVIDFYNFIPVNGAVVWSAAYTIKVIKIDDSVVSFNDGLNDFLATDFLKDILNITGLTPFTNEKNRNIDYRLITERLATAPVIDWTSKFVRRIGEKYTYENYARSNFFRYQYNDKESDYNDGAILIDNSNLAESKEIFKSKMYSPEKSMTDFYIGSLGSTFLRLFKMYEKELKESGNTSTVTYKDLDKRFHYARSNSFPTTVKIGSEYLQQSTTVNSLPLIDFTDLSFQRILNVFYAQLGRILIDSKIHEIELNLNPCDVLNLDMFKMIYFEQEQQYYIIDSIDYDGDEICKGKFVRVKRDPNAVIIPVEPTDPTDYIINVAFSDDTLDPKSGYVQTVAVKLVNLAYPVTDPIVSTTWQNDTGAGYVDLNSSASPYTVNLSPGLNKIRMKGVTQNGISYYSEPLEFTRLVAACKRYRATSFANSGDSVSIYFLNCNTGQPDQVTAYQNLQSGFIEVSTCAIAGSATSDANSSFEDLGLC